MWDYTEKVKEHFLHPRNAGTIEDADGVGEVGSMACGDALRLMFKLDKSGRIIDAKFQTFGCASAIASASALTEMIKGKTLAEAEKITNQDIVNYLGGLPDQKMHCSVLGEEALEAAIRDYRGQQGISQSRIVCHCFNVREDTIEKVVREHHLTSVEAVTNYCKAGGGCGRCREDIAGIIKRVLGENALTADQHVDKEGNKKKMTNMEKMKKIEETINTMIKPALRQDGGDIDLIDVEGNNVKVSLRGACAHCPMSVMTVKNFVEAQLQELVSPDLVVIDTTKRR